MYKPSDIRWIDMDYETAASGINHIQSKGIDEEPANLQADSVPQSTMIGSKASKPRPVIATGKGNVTAVNPLAQSKFSLRDTREKPPPLSNNNVNQRVSEPRRLMLSKESINAKSNHDSSHKASKNGYPSSSMGHFHPSPVLLEQHDSSPIAKSEHAITANDVAKRESILQTSSPSMPPARFAPLPPQSPIATSKWNCKIPYTAIPDHYDYENPSVFEQVHSHVEKGSHLPSMWLAEQTADVPVFQPIGDPVKQASKVSPKFQAPSISDSQTVASDSTFSTRESKICEKDVLKGLQMAMAAACNEEVNAWISEISGCRVRRFLADLSAFEGLGVNPIRTARERTKEYDRKVKAYEHVTMHDRWTEHVISIPRDKDRTMGFVAADEPGQQGLDIAEILRRRQTRASESVKERAVAMGWRERSVSAGC
jgi:hypothetical protein